MKAIIRFLYWLKKVMTTQPTLGALIAGWLSSIESGHTRKSYLTSLRTFTAYMGAADIESAIAALMQNPRHANLVAQSFIEWLRTQDVGNGTINVRLAALRSLTTYIDTNGTGYPLNLKVKGLKYQNYRDTWGLTQDEIKSMLSVLDTRRHTRRGKRDRAMFLLCYLNILGRSEVINLSVSDFNGSRISIQGKGRTEKQPVSIPSATQDAITEWLDVRGDDPGSLFGITGDGWYRILSKLAQDSIGRHITIESLRHAGATHGAKEFDLLTLQAFCRHKDPATTQIYIHNSKDHALQVSTYLQEQLLEETK